MMTQLPQIQAKIYSLIPNSYVQLEDLAVNSNSAVLKNQRSTQNRSSIFDDRSQNLQNSIRSEQLTSPVSAWTQNQTELLFQLFSIWGSRWTKISQQIKTRSQNCVKNRFYGLLRKALRKMNRAAKNLVKKFKKQVKYESITRIIDASQGLYRLQSPLKEESQRVSNKILALAKNNQEQMPCQQAEQLIIEINKFNMATRSYKSTKKIKNHSISSKLNSKQYSLSKKQSINIGKPKIKKIAKYQRQMEQNSSSTHQQNRPFEESPIHINNMGKCQQVKNQQQMINLCQDEYITNSIKVEEVLLIDQIVSQLYSPLECEAWL